MLAPHPDDETLGAGGLLAAASAQGATCWVACATDGNRRGLGHFRTGELRRALSCLGTGISLLERSTYRDGSLSRVSERELTAHVEDVLLGCCPTVLVGPSSYDRHPDHEALARATARVAFKGLRLEYLIHHSHFRATVSHSSRHRLLPPAELTELNWGEVELDDLAYRTKQRALSCHVSQTMNPFLRTVFRRMLASNELFILAGDPAGDPVDG